MKAHASFGDIKDNPAVMRRQAEVNEMLQRLPYVETTFVRHHCMVAPESSCAIKVVDCPRNRAVLALPGEANTLQM